MDQLESYDRDEPNKLLLNGSQFGCEQRGTPTFLPRPENGELCRSACTGEGMVKSQSAYKQLQAILPSF